MMKAKKYTLTYDLVLPDGIEHIEVKFRYFETIVSTINELHKHCTINNIHIIIDLDEWGDNMIISCIKLIILAMLVKVLLVVIDEIFDDD